MSTAKGREGSLRVLREAVEHAAYLRHREGLAAIPASEGRSRIQAENDRCLLGSANLDADCREAYPNDSRWDFVVGYCRDNCPFAHFIEVHPANSSDVSLLADKLAWLKRYLQARPNSELASLPRQCHWVASGKVRIPHHLPQFRRLKKLRRDGLSGPDGQLRLT